MSFGILANITSDEKGKIVAAKKDITNKEIINFYNLLKPKLEFIYILKTYKQYKL